MLRTLGLLVAVSIALLFWAVRPPESSSTHPEAAPRAQAAPASSAALEPPRITRPVPRVEEAPFAGEADEPDPWSGAPEGEPSEPERAAEPAPLQVVEAPNELVEAPAEPKAEPDYVPTSADEALLARAVGFMDELLSAIESNAGDCGRIASSLSDLLSRSRDLIAEGKAMADQPLRSRWFEAQMMPRMAAWTERIMTPMQTCMSDERVVAALTSFAQ